MLAAAGALLASTAYAVTPVVVQGSDFVNAISGSRFQMIGVAYVNGFWRPGNTHANTEAAISLVVQVASTQAAESTL